ncbi:hypothetical protein [Candidatus Phytoplasma sacchari]|nr:hypothetical protein [Candidatus Phytoplasma sacchari]KAB8122852.1 hypothetical protein F2B49_00460 [Candidatus Phytoplasma sacchari]
MFVCFLFNFYKTNLVFAGQFFSKNKKTNFSETEINILRNQFSEIETKILRNQIDYLSRYKKLIFEEI